MESGLGAGNALGSRRKRGRSASGYLLVRALTRSITGPASSPGPLPGADKRARSAVPGLSLFGWVLFDSIMENLRFFISNRTTRPSLLLLLKQNLPGQSRRRVVWSAESPFDVARVMHTRALRPTQLAITCIMHLFHVHSQTTLNSQQPLVPS